ncbi:MAG: hypothetical protein WA857_19345, partial [Candidatus Acidiferrum sp.]
DQRSAERFGELRRRFQRAAGLSDAELAASTASVQQEAPAATIPEIPVMEASAEPAAQVEEPVLEFEEPAAAEPAPAETFTASSSTDASAAHEEVDLSDEWASMLEDSHPAEPTVKPPARPAAEPASPPEVRADPVPAASSEPGEIEEFELPVETSPVLEEEPISFADISAELPPAAEPENIPASVPQNRAPVVPEKPPVAEKPPAPAKPPAPVKPPAKPEPVPEPEPEFELDQDFELVLEPEALVPAYDQKPPATPIVVPEPEPEPEPAAKNSAVPPAEGFASDQFLADLANEIDQLGIGELSPAFSTPAAPAAPLKPEEKPAPGEPSPLKEVFDEFRAELGEMGAEDEDLETHYNLGTAFREMGLVDEAISEFQKVAKATDNGKPFRYGMQCCTLLGLAFMEKGQPGIAAIWYERALLTPGIEPESILALRYDLGVAQESAGEPEAALKSFSQVYAMNIDYRDVADRIAALQKPIR